MKIELKSIKVLERASEETTCFEAVLYVDGKKEGVVSNEGRGGETRFPSYELRKRIDEYAKTLPPITVFGHPLAQTADIVIDIIVADSATAKDVKRRLKNRVLFVRDGKLMETGALAPAQMAEAIKQVAAKPNTRVLNGQPFEEVLAAVKADAAVPR